MTGLFADRLFRVAFAAAGMYNLAFGVWSTAWPLAFFELFDIPPPRYPAIWACLGMVVGLYGLLYLYAAWRLDAASPIVGVGLLGKVLGPIGMATSFSDDWPRRLGMICVYNDLVWWLPFSLFLIRGTAVGKRLAALAPWLAVTTHLLALAMLAVVLRHGALNEPNAAVRAQFVASHATAWTVGWAAWMIAAATLVGFYAWWGSRLTRQRIAALAVVIAGLGLVCDFSGEGLLTLVLVERTMTVGEDPTSFMNVERAFTLLSAGGANGLYTLGGVLLTLVTPNLPALVRAAMWITWISGAAMTAAATFSWIGGMVGSTAVLFPLLVAWMAWMGARWRPA